jgi:hypothetical protein
VLKIVTGNSLSHLAIDESLRVPLRINTGYEERLLSPQHSSIHRHHGSQSARWGRVQQLERFCAQAVQVGRRAHARHVVVLRMIQNAGKPERRERSTMGE